MRKILVAAIAAAMLHSCTTYKCYPSKKSKDYALVKKTPTTKGYKLVFVSGTDTVIKTVQDGWNYKLNQCYLLCL